MFLCLHSGAVLQRLEKMAMAFFTTLQHRVLSVYGQRYSDSVSACVGGRLLWRDQGVGGNRGRRKKKVRAGGSRDSEYRNPFSVKIY